MKSRRLIESLLSSGILIKIKTIRKKPLKNSNKSLKHTKISLIRIKELITIDLVSMLLKWAMEAVAILADLAAFNKVDSPLIMLMMSSSISLKILVSAKTVKILSLLLSSAEVPIKSNPMVKIQATTETKMVSEVSVDSADSVISVALVALITKTISLTIKPLETLVAVACNLCLSAAVAAWEVAEWEELANLSPNKLLFKTACKRQSKRQLSLSQMELEKSQKKLVMVVMSLLINI